MGRLPHSQIPDAFGVRLLNTSVMITAPFKQSFIVLQKIQIMPQSINNQRDSVRFQIMYLRQEFISLLNIPTWVFSSSPLSPSVVQFHPLFYVCCFNDD